MHKTKEDRRKFAQELAITRATRSPAAQIKELDLRLGVGIGAKKERARLAK